MFAATTVSTNSFKDLTKPQTNGLTTDANTVVGVSGGDDTITGGDDDIGTANVIVDGSTVDADTLVVTGRAFQNTFTTATDTIVNIETIDVNFDTLTNASFAADGVISATTLDFENVRAGSGASLTVTAVADGSTVQVADFNTVTATADADGDLTVDADAATTSVTGNVSGDGILDLNAATSAAVISSAATGDTDVAAAAATSITSSSTSGDITVAGSANATVSATSSSAGNVVVNTPLADSVTATTTGAGTVTVTAEGDTAMTVTGRDITVDLQSADTDNTATITATGTGVGINDDALTVTSSDDFAIANAAADAVETITVNGGAEIVTTITTTAADAYVGDANVTFSGDHAMFHETAVTGGAAVTVTAMDLATDLSEATAGIELSADVNGVILSVNDNATVTLSSDQTALEINADDDVATTATTFLQGTLNLIVDNNQTGTITIDPSSAGTDGFDTVNVDVTEAITTGLDLRTAATTEIVLSGAVDVTVDGTTTGASLDASGLSGALTAEQTGNLLSVTAGSGNDALTSDSTSADAVVNAGDGNDSLDLGGAFVGTADGGNGTDELDVTAAVNLSNATITGFETIDVNNFDVSFDEAVFNGAGLVVQSSGGGAETITLTNITASTDLSNLAFADTNVTMNIDYAQRLDSSLGTGAATSITGSSAVDVIVGGAGGDTLFGLDGADGITGGDGADYIDGGDGSDTSLAGGNGADTVLGGDGDDTITGAAGDDTLDGGDGADNISGGADDDAITAGEGADTVDGGLGVDTIDLTETSSAADVIVVDSVVGTSSDSARVEVAGDNNDTGEDVITAFNFTNDTIQIVATDVVGFVHGTDTAIGTATGDVNDGTVGSFATSVGLVELNQATDGDWDDDGDIALTFASPSAALTEARFEAVLGYNITGTAAANTITTGAGDDVITGGAGADVIDGGVGSDTYILGAQTDSEVATVAATNVASAGIDQYTVTAGDIFDFTGVTATTDADIGGTAVAVPIAAGAESTGTDFLAAIDTAVTNAATTAGDVVAGNLYLVTVTDASTDTTADGDFDGSYLVLADDGTIDGGDWIVQITGGTPAFTITSGDGIIA